MRCMICFFGDGKNAREWNRMPIILFWTEYIFFYFLIKSWITSYIFCMIQRMMHQKTHICWSISLPCNPDIVGFLDPRASSSQQTSTMNPDMTELNLGASKGMYLGSDACGYVSTRAIWLCYWHDRLGRVVDEVGFGVRGWIRPWMRFQRYPGRKLEVLFFWVNPAIFCIQGGRVLVLETLVTIQLNSNNPLTISFFTNVSVLRSKDISWKKHPRVGCVPDRQTCRTDPGDRLGLFSSARLGPTLWAHQPFQCRHRILDHQQVYRPLFLGVCAFKNSMLTKCILIDVKRYCAVLMFRVWMVSDLLVWSNFTRFSCQGTGGWIDVLSWAWYLRWFTCFS